MDMNPIPDKWIPKISFASFNFNPIFNEELYSASGY